MPYWKSLDLPGVYCITNWHRYYIGSATKTIRHRTNEHYRLLRLNKHPNRHLQSAWNKYGEEKFIVAVIECCAPEKCIEREQYWMDWFESYKHGFNLCPTAGNMYGFRHSEESLEKCRRSQRRWRIGRHGPMLGRKQTEEAKRKMSIAKKGKPGTRLGSSPSEETRRKISETLKERNRKRRETNASNNETI